MTERPSLPVARVLVDTLLQLASTGQSSAAPLASLTGGHAAGWWTVAGTKATASTRLMALVDAVPSPAEVPAAILAREPEIQAAWARVIAAHLVDAGSRRDRTQLCDDIGGLGAAAAVVLAVKSQANLGQTPWTEIEHLVLGAPAQEASARPRLVRALAAAASQPVLPPVVALPPVDSLQPAKTWTRGRLLQLPETNPAVVTWDGGILTGRCSTLPAPDSGHDGVMRWVLDRPWAYLLAQIVFVQEAWQAERISGRITLEVAEDQRDLMRGPPSVQVVVTRANGQEVQCGTLGDFLRRILGTLGVGIIAHRLTATTLDTSIAPVIGVLLEREIWQADYGGLGRRPGYVIHPKFSDTWGRIGLGSRVFYRASAPVTAAIRRVAETWADERCAVAANLVASTRVL